MLDALRRLYLVRHGETDWNRQGRFQGLVDEPLNDLGRAQARALGARLRDVAFDAVYASPLVRAAETAEIVCETLGRTPLVVADLQERDVGAWGGLTYEQVRQHFPDEWTRVAAGEDVAVGGGETKAAVQRRVATALERLAARHPGGTVLVVSHGLALKTLVCHLIGLDLAHSDRLTTGGNTGLTVFEMRRGRPRMATYADVSHLEGVTASR